MTGIILKENSGILTQHKQNDTKNTQNKQQQQQYIKMLNRKSLPDFKLVKYSKYSLSTCCWLLLM